MEELVVIFPLKFGGVGVQVTWYPNNLQPFKLFGLILIVADVVSVVDLDTDGESGKATIICLIVLETVLYII